MPALPDASSDPPPALHADKARQARPAAELYVYYRVQPGREADVWRAVCNMHAQLSSRLPGVTARLLRRCDTAPQPAAGATWMEIYQRAGGLPRDFAEHLESEAQAWAGDLAGPRHLEWFEPCAW